MFFPILPMGWRGSRTRRGPTAKEAGERARAGE
jgi:hypothetical protein